MVEAKSFPKFQSTKDLLNEIRCEESVLHRIQAAKILLKQEDSPDRIPYLTNMILYDPDPEVRAQIKGLLLEQYGKELETMLHVESAGGVPIESPWIIPCQSKKQNTLQPVKLVEDWAVQGKLEDLHNFLRDPLKVANRLAAAKALANDTSEENFEMLAKAVLFDPDESVQQQAYQSLYEAAGDIKAEAVLNQIGANSSDEETDWLLIPDNFSENEEFFEEDIEASPFGINKADQIRGLINLFTGERNPEKRIAILRTLAISNNVTANEAIARVGLFDNDPQVREIAKSELHNRLGDHLEEFLEHVYNTSSAIYPDPDEIDETEVEPYSNYENHNINTQIETQPSVIQEDNSHQSLIVITLIVIIGIVMFFIFK